MLILIIGCSQQQSEEQPEQPSGNVIFPDENLAAKVRGTLALKPEDRITHEKLKKLTTLSAFHRDIADLTGLEHATNLTFLELFDNSISDITPLTDLTNLKDLYLNGNQINDITQIGQIKNLTYLSLIQKSNSGYLTTQPTDKSLRISPR